MSVKTAFVIVKERCALFRCAPLYYITYLASGFYS
nr:MAG TPA: hypothetical protein [Caudoviricetes sp.]DAT10719.1 MAG TPA: hypothetical protein [Caudoviricetes sp.]